MKGGAGEELFVVGTSRLVEDRTAQQFADGAVFFENAVDYFALGEQLIGIRSRAVQAPQIMNNPSTVVKRVILLQACIVASTKSLRPEELLL